MKPWATFITVSLFAFVTQAHEQAKADTETVEKKKLASFRVEDTYHVELYAKPKPMQFNVAGRIETPTWTMVWLEATDLKTETTRRVWATYDPWNASSAGPRKVAFSVRNDHIIALAYPEGALVRFYQIDLTQQVEPPKIPDQPLRPGAAYAPPWALLNSSQSRHTLDFVKTLQQIHGEQRADALLAKNELRIKDVTWSDEKWRVTLTLGNSEFIFVRGEDDETWQRQNAPE